MLRMISKAYQLRVPLLAGITLLLIALSVLYTQAQENNRVWPCANFTLPADIVTQQRTAPDWLPSTETQTVRAGATYRFIGRSSLDDYWIIEWQQEEGNGTVTAGFGFIDRATLDTLGSGVSEALFGVPPDVPPSCEPSWWGAPPLPNTQLHTLRAEVGLATSWIPYAGQGIRIGLIDAHYEGLAEFLTNCNRPRPPYQIINLVDDLPQPVIPPGLPTESCPDETIIISDETHGTDMLRVLTAIAPRATYYLARAHSGREFASAVTQLEREDVQIIVNATNVFAPQDVRLYHRVVEHAVNQRGILWINSAGNIGAGYYSGSLNYRPSNGGYSVVEDANRPDTGPRNSLAVAFDPNRLPTIHMRWQADDDTLELKPQIHRDSGLLFPAIRVTQSCSVQEALRPYSQYRVITPNCWIEREAGWHDGIAFPGELFNDELGIPEPGQPIRDQNPDGILDTVYYIFITASHSATAHFELFIEGALPAEYDPYISHSLDPVVLAPADMAEVFTVGSFGLTDDQMAWWSSRFNSSQYEAVEQEFVKPDIVTYPRIEFADGVFFEGTSASTAIVGGVAAVVASRNPNDFDAETVRALLENPTDMSQCLDDDGAVGRVLHRLSLPPAGELPIDVESLEAVDCGTYIVGSTPITPIVSSDETTEEPLSVTEETTPADDPADTPATTSPDDVNEDTPLPDESADITATTPPPVTDETVPPDEPTYTPSVTLPDGVSEGTLPPDESADTPATTPPDVTEETASVDEPAGTPDTTLPDVTEETVPPDESATLSPIEPPTITAAGINATFNTGGVDASIQISPNVSASSTATIPDGSPVTVLGELQDGSWYYVEVNGVTGWVPAAQVSIPTIDTGGTTSTTTAPAVVVYASDASGSWQIYGEGASGEQTPLTSEGGNEYPSLSPDGGQIVFTSDRDGNREIYVMNADGSEQRNLTNHPATDERPEWSPDGRTIIFESDRAGNRNLFGITVATGQVVQVTHDTGETCCVAWSRDGNRIAYSSNLDGFYQIYVANVDGSGALNLTNLAGTSVYPAWQPGGTTIAFQSDRDGNWEIYIVQIDGSGLRQLTNTEGFSNVQPVWSSDGREIYFASDRNGEYDLYVMSADGTNQRAVTSAPGSEVGPAVGGQ